MGQPWIQGDIEMYNKLMSYLSGQGMQPGALDRLIQKMQQTRGPEPMFSTKKQGMRGNQSALKGQKPRPRMYAGI